MTPLSATAQYYITVTASINVYCRANQTGLSCLWKDAQI